MTRNCQNNEGCVGKGNAADFGSREPNHCWKELSVEVGGVHDETSHYCQACRWVAPKLGWLHHYTRSKAAGCLSILLTTTYDHMLQTKLTYHNIVHMPACCTAVYTSALSTLGVIATFLLIFLAYFNLVSACTSIPSSGAEFCRLHTTTQQEYEGGYGEALWFSLNMRKTSFKMRNRVLPRVAQLPYCRRQI